MGQLKQREDQRDIDNRRLRVIRRGCDMASRDWIIVAANGATTLSTQSPDGVTTIATFDERAPMDDRDFLMRAPEAVFFLLRLLDEAYHAIRQMRGQRPYEGQDRSSQRSQITQSKPKDYAAECAMKGTEAAFGLFLIDRYQMQPPATAESVAVKVKSILKIGSRSDLNKDAAAAHRWTDLRSEYDAWRRT